MSLTASLWTGVSGLKGHGQKMGVIGNNIANVSTLGFKGSRMHFEDFMSQNVSTASGLGQVGRGVAVGTVLGDFSQGSLETTNEATDVAISGNGFFLVSPPNEDMTYYTRAGNFRFDNDGYYVDPHGYRVQGWEMEDGAIAGVPGDVRLENFQSKPEATSNISMIVNLDSRAETNTGVQPLWDQWDGAAVPPIGADEYSYQSTLRVYDQNGGSHNATIYFDRAQDPGAVAIEPNMTWDFIVTVPPDSDERVPPPAAGDEGLIQRGQVIFNPDGSMQNIIFYNAAGVAINSDAMEFRNGKPLITMNFLGAGEDFDVELDFGMNFTGVPGAAAPGAGDWAREARASSSFASASSTLFQSQDGYTSGVLQNVSIGRDGVMTGRYSNGQVQELFTLTLGDFNNVWGLRREGGNLFAESRESGPAITGIAGTGRLGTVSGNALELSNVDLATEFVKMISTQKGFQANSKTITTTDTMLDEVIRMKR